MVFQSRKVCSVVSLLVMGDRSADQCEPVTVVFEQDAKGVEHVPRHGAVECRVYRASMTVVAIARD
jgi:hypothetical protein